MSDFSSNNVIKMKIFNFDYFIEIITNRIFNINLF